VNKNNNNKKARRKPLGIPKGERLIRVQGHKKEAAREVPDPLDPAFFDSSV